MQDQKLQYTVFMIKETYQEFNEIIDLVKCKEEVELKSSFNINGKLFIGHNDEKEPPWYKVLKEGIISSTELINQSTRAVLLLKRKNRIFAFTFGHGKVMIKAETYERGFGMKIVLNNCEIDKLKSIDSATIDTVTVQARTQTSKSADLSNFQIDNSRDFLKAVKAEANDFDRYGKVLSGRDSFHFTDSFSFYDLNGICDRLMKDYNSKKYKENFEWIDHLQEIRDPGLKDDLNKRLVAQINNLMNGITVENIHLAPPEIMDIENNEFYKYKERAGELYNELDINAYLEQKKPQKNTYDLQKLNRDKIYVCDSNGNIINKWSVFNCIVTEFIYKDMQYVFSMGDWYQVDKGYMDKINEEIQDIEDCPIKLKNFDKRIHKSEQKYNLSASGDSLDGKHKILCMDSKNIHYNGGRFEFCDLFSSEKHIIHVKPWSSSSTLSHLFSQGRVSAEAMANMEEVREEIRGKLSETDESFSRHMDINNFSPRDYTIVYAIIYEGNKELHERIPFFSKLNLVHHKKSLKRMQFKVQKMHIERIN